jgi:hypothetical protein
MDFDILWNIMDTISLSGTINPKETKHMNNHRRPFPWRCFDCKTYTVYECVIKNFETKVGDQRVIVPEFSVAKCSTCGGLHIDIFADNQIRKAYNNVRHL